MPFLKMLETFRKDDDGAMTVDWVALTAACLGLGVAVLAAISGGADDVSGRIAQQVKDTSVTPSFDSADDRSAPTTP